MQETPEKHNGMRIVNGSGMRIVVAIVVCLAIAVVAVLIQEIPANKGNVYAVAVIFGQGDAARVHLLGGAISGSGPRNSHSIYHTGNNSWTDGLPMPEKREGPAAAALGSHVVVVGGFGGGNCWSSVISLDTSNASAVWVNQTSLPPGRYLFSAVALSETLVLVMGGSVCGGSYSKEVFEARRLLSRTTLLHDMSSHLHSHSWSLAAPRGFPSRVCLSHTQHHPTNFTFENRVKNGDFWLKINFKGSIFAI